MRIDLFSWIIIAAGVLVGIAMVYAFSKFKTQLDEYDRKKDEGEDEADAKLENDDVYLDRKSKGIKVAFMEKMENTYNNNCIFHNGLIQIISLFPMLGLLGTVVGLMRLITDKGIQEMTSSVGLALVSTTCGLICAILLKFLDAVLVSPTSERVQNLITKHSKEFDNISKKQSIKRG